jgi:hypothetical protein
MIEVKVLVWLKYLMTKDKLVLFLDQHLKLIIYMVIPIQVQLNMFHLKTIYFMKTLTKKQQFKIEETLKDFKCLAPRFNQIKDNPRLVRSFCSRNRNPLFDITNTKYFSTGLKSKGVLENTTDEKVTKDHFIQRSLSMKLIFSEITKNPKMSTKKFIDLITKYSSTVEVLKSEHKKIGVTTRGTQLYNFRVYDEVGIEVDGLDEHLKLIGLVK